MQPLTLEWVEKAEGDFATATRELRVRKGPNYDAVCFHAQQCAEKYLKARLQEGNIHIEPTHNLIWLLDLLLPLEPTWEALRPHLRAITQFGVDIRYPGQMTHKPIARQALQHCTEVRRVVRLGLGLPS